ncbi:hypothetical protein AVEN_131076-1 [Araneus ventricosus]|uniref:Uncharacterized protein n=1 Tax=Araneus ventricosus TaxID=182803 RepID=A0A4Y2D1Z0_ARAVE|nr:hypothetical protein AVEN_131076-1 [Araneus ventricosus]
MMCGVCTVQNGIHATLRSGIYAAVSFVRDAAINKIEMYLSVSYFIMLLNFMLLNTYLGCLYRSIGRKLTRYQVGSLICDAWNKSATVGNVTRGFKVTGIFPFKNNALPDQLFFALADSEMPVPENTTQEEANSSSEVLIKTPQINLQPAEPGTSSVKPPSPTKRVHKISPIPIFSQVRAKHIIKKTAVLLTSIDNRNALKANLEN